MQAEGWDPSSHRRTKCYGHTTKMQYGGRWNATSKGGSNNSTITTER